VTRLSYNQILERALGRIRQGDGSGALVLLDPLARQRANDPNVLHLTGLARKANGDVAGAVDALRSALALAPRQPVILSNLANALRQHGDAAQAEQCFRRAVSLQPDFTDAWRNLGILMLDAERADEAYEALQRADALQPDDARTLTLLASAQQLRGEADEAIRLLERAVALRPDYVNAVHNLGLALKRIGRHGEAIEYYRKALLLAPQAAEIHYNLGNALFDLEDFAAAEAAWLEAIRLKPTYVDAHITLNELYWQRGRTERYGVSFAEAAAAGHLDADLAVAWVRGLTLADRVDEAAAVIASALERHGEVPELLRWRARLSRRIGDLPAAIEALDRAILAGTGERAGVDKAGPGRPGSHGITAEKLLRQDLVELLLISGDLDRADDVLNELLAIDSLDQLSWALRGTAWRLTGDARYDWLHDYERFVRPFTLPVPPGYASLEAFLEELSAVLAGLHRFDVQPLEQTLNNGTQTPGGLLERREPVIVALRGALSEVVNEYIHSLDTDAEHPFLGRNTGAFRFSGSWSVRLVPGGFHVNHVHPAGWISSSCYVSVPASMRAPTDAHPHAGWIQFGQSSLRLGAADAPCRLVQPKAGMAVLFPSSTWHGTVPFHGDAKEFRMTAPFDAVPA
jgi:tetratricopeptide (TPR) repeat protein